MARQIFEIAGSTTFFISALGKFGQLGYIERTFNIKEIDHEHGRQRPGEA
jgi:hypothetical protein